MSIFDVFNDPEANEYVPPPAPITINGFTRTPEKGGTYTEDPTNAWFHYWWPLPGETSGVDWWPNDDRNNPDLHPTT